VAQELSAEAPVLCGLLSERRTSLRYERAFSI
jgi:hypothetical protein